MPSAIVRRIGGLRIRFVTLYAKCFVRFRGVEYTGWMDLIESRRVYALPAGVILTYLGRLRCFGGTLNFATGGTVMHGWAPGKGFLGPKSLNIIISQLKTSFAR